MIKPTLLLSLLCISATGVFSQQPSQVIPPSPEAAILGKYGDFEVNLSTGILEHSIPIYEIKTNHLSLPISLNYSSSGVRVNDIASWVGLNWSLSAGGLVTRSVQGFPDEDQRGYISGTNRTIPTTRSLDENALQDFNYLFDISEGRIDTEPDIYYYNFGRYSGKFVFDSQGNPILLNHDKMKIERFSMNHFQIMTPDGVKYVFKDTEITSPSGYNFVSSWYLTEIIASGDLDTIRFFYESYNSQSIIYPTQSDALPVTTGFACNDHSGLATYGSHTVNSIANTKKISRIEFQGGKILFSSVKDRQDHSWAYRLTNITVIKDINGSNIVTETNFVKGVDLGYSYLNDNITEAGYKRLLLKSVESRNYSDSENSMYSFVYFEQSTQGGYSLPKTGSKQQDFWGFYNGASSNESLPSMIPTFTYNGTSKGGANRESGSVNFMRAGTLQSIIYPTGGRSDFEYECNQTGGGTDPKPLRTVGGLRISLITNYESGGKMAGRKRYRYNYSTNASSGYLIVEPLSFSLRKIWRFMGPSNIKCINPPFEEPWDCVPKDDNNMVRLCDFYVLTSYDLSSLGSSSGLHLGYKKVVEENLDANGVSSGRTDYYFSWGYDQGSYDIFPFPPPNSFQAHRGKLEKKELYNKSGQLIESIIIDNHFEIVRSLPALKADKFMLNHPCYIGEQPGNLCRNSLLQKFEYATYYHHVFRHYVNKETVTTQDVSGNELVRITEYEYENADHLQLTKKRVTKSDGRVEITEFKYPLDFSSLNSTPVINEMKGTRYMHNQVIQKISKIKDENNEYVVDCSINIPSLFNNSSGGKSVLIKEAVSLLKSSPIHIGNFEAYVPVNGYNISKYFKSLVYDNYDGSGNLLQYTPIDGIPRSYEWGYNRQYPIAEVVNAENNLSTTSNNVTLNGSVTMPSTSSVSGSFTSTSSGTIVLTAQGDPGNAYTVRYELSGPSSKSGYLCATRNSTSCSYPSSVTHTGMPAGTYTLTLYNYSGSAYKSVTYTYPGTQTVTTGTKNFYHTSFEEIEGNSNEAKTGKRSKTGGYNKMLTNLTAGRYILSYWKKSGSTWDFVENDNIQVTGTSYQISIGSSVHLDELRFYPFDAQMTTYTYAPLVGMTSQCDLNNRVTYFEYDGFQRLILIRDQDKNIVKKICYNYAGQPENCNN